MTQGAADGGIQPIGDRILVRHVEHGVERTLPSGIVIPATVERSVHTKGDYFRARVMALGPEAVRQVPDLKPGDDVLVYWYSGNGESVWTGESTGEGLFIRPDDVLGVVES